MFSEVKNINGKQNYVGLLYAAVVFTVAAFMVLLDLPKPMMDDAFFIGTSVNLYRGGDFANPWLADLQKYFTHCQSTRFYVYAPMYPILLYGWLKVFGLSAVSILSYSASMLVISSAGWYFLCRKLNFSWPSFYLFPIAYGGWLITMSALRPDNTGVALLLSGLTLALYWRSIWGHFLAFTVIGAALSTQPRLGIFAVFLTALILCMCWMDDGKKRDDFIYWCWVRVLVLVAAIVLHVVILHAIIRGEWNIFLHDFLHSASGTQFASDVWKKFIDFWIGTNLLNISGACLYWGLRFTGLVALVVLIFRWKNIQSFQRYFMLAWLLSTLLTMLVATPNYFPLLTTWLFAMLVFGTFGPRRSQWLIVLFGVAVLFVAQWSRVLVHHFMAQITNPGQRIIVQNFLSKNPNALILADCDAIRYVFNYNLPENSLIYEWSAFENARFPHPFTPLEKACPKIWVLSPNCLPHISPRLTQGIPSPEYVKILNREFGNMLLKPREMILITDKPEN